MEQENFHEELYNVFHHFVYKARMEILQQMRYPIDEDNFRIAIPKFLLKEIMIMLQFKYKINHLDDNQLKYMGIPIVEGYEMKFVFFHVDYPLLQDPKLKIEHELKSVAYKKIDFGFVREFNL